MKTAADKAAKEHKDLTASIEAQKKANAPKDMGKLAGALGALGGPLGTVAGRGAGAVHAIREMGAAARTTNAAAPPAANPPTARRYRPRSRESGWARE